MEPADGIVRFFEKLGRRGHEPLLAKVTGRVRFDLVEGGRTDRWLVAVDKGDTAVSQMGLRREVHHPGQPAARLCGDLRCCTAL